MLVNVQAIALYLAICALTAGVTWALIPPPFRKTALALLGIGLVTALLKIWLFQQAPQWHDINPDSITYARNGQAFARHWAGQMSDVEEYRLRGAMAWHKAGLASHVWSPEDRRSYASIVGSHEWLYAAYVGLWYVVSDEARAVAWAIYAHAAFAAFFPVAAFGLARSLGANLKVGVLAAGLAIIDPSSGVNAAWLLKDTIAGFLTMASIMAALRYLETLAQRYLVWFVLLSGVLGSVRFVAFAAILIAATITAFRTRWADRRARARVLAAVGAACLTFGMIAQYPTSEVSLEFGRRVVATPARVVQGGGDTLAAERNSEYADETVLRWKEGLRDHSVLSLVKSAAHTLFAPYPWVAIHPGLTWRSANELYYPGVILWILCLPGIGLALARMRRQPSRRPAFEFVVSFLFLVLAAYTVFQGEWSTRQRVFALPAFFALAAIGWATIVSEGLSSKKDEVNGERAT